MQNESIQALNTTLTPTRRLTTKERAVFEKVTDEFSHLTCADEEALTQYAEAVSRYHLAAKDTKRHPTVSIPVVNRATGNIVGSKDVRNPAFVTLRESSAQMVSLGRRLLIDAHSAEKRLRMDSKLARSAAAVAADGNKANPSAGEMTDEEFMTFCYDDPELEYIFGKRPDPLYN